MKTEIVNKEEHGEEAEFEASMMAQMDRLVMMERERVLLEAD